MAGVIKRTFKDVTRFFWNYSWLLKCTVFFASLIKVFSHIGTNFLHMSWQSYYDAIQFVSLLNTAWKESKYGVLPGPYFHAFGLNTERYGVSLRIQSECRKIRTRKNSVFGHFSRSASCKVPQIQQTIKCLSNTVLFM